MAGISGVTERAKVGAVGPYSRPAALRKLDGRTRESRLMRDTRAELVAHVGGNPSATQRALIERAVSLSLHVALLDAKQSATGLTPHDTREYLAWTNTLTRLMRQLGMKSAAQQPPSLRDHIAARAAAGP